VGTTRGFRVSENLQTEEGVKFNKKKIRMVLDNLRSILAKLN